MAKAKTEEATAETGNGEEQPVQQDLPGAEQPRHKDIERLAAQFVQARNAWQALHDPMMNKRDLLEAKMKEHGLKAYEFDGKVVELVQSEKCRVRTKKEDGDE